MFALGPTRQLAIGIPSKQHFQDNENTVEAHSDRAVPLGQNTRPGLARAAERGRSKTSTVHSRHPSLLACLRLAAWSETPTPTTQVIFRGQERRQRRHLILVELEVEHVGVVCLCRRPLPVSTLAPPYESWRDVY